MAGMDSKDAPQMIEHIRKSVNYTPHDTKWIPCSARFISCGISPSGKGCLSIYELSHGELQTTFECLDVQVSANGSGGNGGGIKCATFGASRIQDRHLAIGDYNGTLSILDLEQSSTKSTKSTTKATTSTSTPTTTTTTTTTLYSVKGHRGIINAIDGIGGTTIGNGAPELVTGGKDGIVHVWDPRVSNPVVTLEPQVHTDSRDCWTVAFGNSYNQEERCVCAGYDNGDIKLFDLRTQSIRWEENCSNGVTSLEFDRDDIEMNKLVVTTLESKLHCYDMRTQHSQDGFSYCEERAHRSTVWLGRHLPQNRDVFMTGGGNGGFNIYKYHYPLNRVGKHQKDGKPIGVMGNVELLNSRIISTQPLVSFDWSPDRAGLCCMSCLDQTIRVYIVTKLDKY